jgi:hypothetical protein
VADKLTQQIIDALARAAADPGGLPLFAAKSEVGLFPSAAPGKLASQKCLSDELIRVIRTEAKARTTRELYGLTDRGWEFLLAAVNPKQVLEDFVRVLEARQGEVGELLDTARQMADSLQGLKEAVSRVLPRVTATRIPLSRDAERSEPSAPALRSENSASRLSDQLNGTPHMNGTAVLDVPAVAKTDLAAAVLARLTDWAASANAGEDCPLPELYRGLSVLDPPPTIGAFHDCLRQLHADGSIYLHPWTGPLYALPEPAYALLVGHGVAYYASTRA